jgi:magnesium-transporting ATPase (P-type)
VGISGREGKHAANSADFAIGQFRFIVPLLLVYGRYIYLRSSKLVLYSFFKNLVLVSTLFYFCIYSGFSGTMYLDSIVFSGFNFYLGMPIVILGIFDKDVPVELVYKYPKLAYQSGRRNELMSMGNFFRCVCRHAMHTCMPCNAPI